MTAIGGGTASQCDRDERTGERRSKQHAQRRQLANINHERRGEALPRTDAVRKPIFCRHGSEEEEARTPRRDDNMARKISTTVHGGGGVAEVQLKPIYMHILLVKDVAEVDADGN